MKVIKLRKDTAMKKIGPILYCVLVLLVASLFLTQCAPPKTEDPLEGCFIATAAYGTPSAEEIDILRQFRDEFLSNSSAGDWFIRNYYRYSPPVAGFIAKHEALRTFVRESFVGPIVNMVELTERWWRE